MDTLKQEALKQGRWRLGEDGYVEKGPFPTEKSSVNVTVQSVGDDGASVLMLTPRHAGDSPHIHYSAKQAVSESDPKVEDLDNFRTEEGSLYFWAKDTTGEFEPGPSVRWLADIKVRHQVDPAADKRKVTLQASPRAKLLYTTDGSNPKDGIEYSDPFEIGSSEVRLLVYAQSGEATKNADFRIPASGDTTVQVDDSRPAKLQKKRVTLDNTDKVFGVINKFRDSGNTRFKGVRIEIGEGEHTVSVRFQEREITAGMMEGVVNSLRDVLDDHAAQLAVTIADGIQFESGFDVKEFAKLASLELRPGDSLP